MGEMIDGNAAFKADAHSTEWTPELAGNGVPKARLARDQDGGSDSRPLRDTH